MFDTGKWEWTVRQRFIKEPRIKLHDMLTILDEVKAEIIASEETEKQDEMTPRRSDSSNTTRNTKDIMMTRSIHFFLSTPIII